MANPPEAAWRAYLGAARRAYAMLQVQRPSLFPHYTQDGRWHYLDAHKTSAWADGVYDHGNWTAGFSIGVLWLLWLSGGDPDVAALGRTRLAQLGPRADDTSTHDLGFLFFPSFAFGQIAGALSKEEVRPAVEATETLARRFNHNGQFLQAFGPVGERRSAGTSTIDTMMNLPLLWWARDLSDGRVGELAIQHARTAARLFFRPDGSTYHLIEFDPLSGALRKRGTYQGSGDESCWSRGQAWAIAGFAWAHLASGEGEFLTAAERASLYFLDRLPSSGVPPWDFSDPDPGAPLDASAAAIAALGLLILGETHPKNDVARSFWETGRDLVGRLSERCLNTTADVDGILLESCYSRPHNLGIRGAVAWGDFYYGLALALAVDALDPSRLVGAGMGPSGRVAMPPQTTGVLQRTGPGTSAAPRHERSPELPRDRTGASAGHVSGN